MTAKNVSTHEDLVREYRRVFKSEPEITGADWFHNPTELIVEALETGVPIKQQPVPEGIDT